MAALELGVIGTGVIGVIDVAVPTAGWFVAIGDYRSGDTNRLMDWNAEGCSFSTVAVIPMD
jgi:hypothetical protein